MLFFNLHATTSGGELLVSYMEAIKIRKKAIEKGWTERTLVDWDLNPWPEGKDWGLPNELGNYMWGGGPWPLVVSTTEILDTKPKGNSWVWDDERQSLISLPPKYLRDGFSKSHYFPFNIR